jgi:zinc/manganese transport system permease protein
MIDILLPAFIISLVLLGIHSYFGLHIIKRGIIFTDLAIGQMAALGAAVSILAFDGTYMYAVSLASALAGGLIILTLSKVSEHLEAVIGLMYAMGISGVFILLSKSPHGAEQFQNLMAYDILFTKTEDIIAAAVLYTFIGIIIRFFEGRLGDNKNDLLFFITFAVTVTSSVRMAGVLVVFAILLAPAFISLQLGSLRAIPLALKKHPLLTAWAIGISINLISIIISYTMDFPTGYTLVFIMSFAAVISSIFIRGGSEKK